MTPDRRNPEPGPGETPEEPAARAHKPIREGDQPDEDLIALVDAVINEGEEIIERRKALEEEWESLGDQLRRAENAKDAEEAQWLIGKRRDVDAELARLVKACAGIRVRMKQLERVRPGVISARRNELR